MIDKATRAAIMQRLEEDVTIRIGETARDLEESEIEQIIRQSLRFIASGIVDLTPQEEDEIACAFADDLLRLGPLEAFLADERISEIMVNGGGFDSTATIKQAPEVFYEMQGRIIRYPEPLFESDAQVERIIGQIGQEVGRSCTSADPIMNARLRDGSRILATHSDISPDGPTLTIRRFRKDALTPASLVQAGTCTQRVMDFLEICIRSRVNIFITGGTGSGKTTLLNALSYFIPDDERIITIEDPIELQLKQPNLVRLEARPANTEGEGEITVHSLLIASLRMRPDRIVVGEVRDVAAIDMLTAMTTGHDGSLSTLHANDTLGAFGRLRTMVQTARPNMTIQAIDSLIAEAVELIIHVERDSSGTRRITDVTAVEGYGEGTIVHSPLFAYLPQEGLVAQGVQPTRIKHKIERHDARLYRPELFFPGNGDGWSW